MFTGQQIRQILKASKTSFLFFLILCLFLICVPYHSYAQKIITTTSKITKPIEFSGRKYHPATYASMSALLWRFNVHDINDNNALGEFIIINNCDIYAPYVNDDFAWSRILESKKRQIQYFPQLINQRFVFSDVIQLSRFDFQRNIFHLASESIMKNMGIMSVFNMHNYDLSYCTAPYQKDLELHPKQISLRLENPISIESFPIDPRGAEKLIEEFIETDNKDRKMFSRLFIKVTAVDDHDIKGSVRDFVTYVGFLERFEIYSDIEMTNLVHYSNFR